MRMNGQAPRFAELRARAEAENQQAMAVMPNVMEAPPPDAVNPQDIPIPGQHPPAENPFAAEQYRNVGVPDVPVQYGGGMAEMLLNDNIVPEDVKKRFWFVFHPDNTLTFLDEERKRSKMLNFDISKIDVLNATPYYDYTFEKELEFNVLRNVFETKLDRALGFRGQNMKNERIVLQSQFSEQRQISEHGQGDQIKEGFFKRLLGRR